MERIVVGILIALVGGTTERVHPQGNRLEAEMRRALADLNEGNLLEALAQFRRAIEEDPTSAAAHFYLSTIYTAMGEYDMADRFLAAALDIEPREGTFHYQRGVIRHGQGDRPGALESFEEALRLGLGTRAGAAWRHVGEVEVELLEWEKALEAYNRAFGLDREDSRTLLARGQLYYDQDELELAVADLRRALEIEPTLGPAYRTLGLAYRRRGEEQLSVDTLRKGLESDPSDQMMRYSLAQSLMSMNRNAEAQETIEEYNRIQEIVLRASGALEMGQKKIETGDLAEAMPLLEEAVRLAPGSGEAQQALGAVLIERGEWDRAIEALTLAIVAYPLSAEAHFSLSRAYIETGRLAEAREAIARAVLIDPDQVSYTEYQRELASRTGP